MNHDEIILLVQECIANSELKLDSAQILAKNRKFEDAIVLAIIAYEEAGKADFLINSIIYKKTISDDDWRKLTRGGSHETKLIMYYENRKKTFEMMSDSDFTALQIPSKKISSVNPRNQLLEGFKKKIKIFKKLNALKKNIAYVDNQPKNEKLTKNELDIIFSYLDFETRTSIFLTKFELDSNSFVSTGNDLEDSRKFIKLGSFKDWLDLRNESVIPNNAQKCILAQSLLEKM